MRHGQWQGGGLEHGIMMIGGDGVGGEERTVVIVEPR